VSRLATLVASLSAALLAGESAAGEPFEGVLTFRVVAPGGKGEVVTQVSPLGVHSAVRVAYLKESVDTQVVVRARDPQVTWQWVAAERRFVEVPASPSPGRDFTAEVEGPAVVASVPCTRVRLRGAQGVQAYCIARGFLGSPSREALVQAAQRLAPDVEAALKKAGVQGLVVRQEQTSPDGKAETGFELVKAVRQKVPRGLFSLEPPGAERGP
jgi:hypothetical protein